MINGNIKFQQCSINLPRVIDGLKIQNSGGQKILKINHYEPIRDYKRDGETNFYYIGLIHSIPAENFPDDAGSNIEVQYEDYDYTIEQAKALGYEVGTPIERFEAFDFLFW
jgi:hypothetical protein